MTLSSGASSRTHLTVTIKLAAQSKTSRLFWTCMLLVCYFMPCITKKKMTCCVLQRCLPRSGWLEQGCRGFIVDGGQIKAEASHQIKIRDGKVSGFCCQKYLCCRWIHGWILSWHRFLVIKGGLDLNYNLDSSIYWLNVSLYWFIC